MNLLRVLSLSALFLLSVSIAQAQLDTSALGWRNRPNRFTMENEFTQPIRRLPTPIPQDEQAYEVMTWQVTDSSKPWGIHVLHSVPGLNDDGYHSESMTLGLNNDGHYGYGQRNWGMWLKMENYYNHGYSAPPRGPIMETHFEYLGEDARTVRSWTAYNATADGRGLMHEMAYDVVAFTNGSGVSPASQDSIALMLHTPRTINGSYQLGEMNLYKTMITLKSNNVWFLRQWAASDSLAQVPLMKLDDQNNAMFGSKVPIDQWYNGPRKATLAARQVFVEADAFNSKVGFFANKFHFGTPFSGTDSTLQLAGGAHFTGGLHTASSFGKDSLTVATNGYVNTRIAASEVEVTGFLSDTLDANTRQYVRLNVLSDSLNTLPRQSGVSAAQLRDTLDANARQYVRSNVLSDSLDALPRQSGLSSAQLRDTLDANARQYVRSNVLSDSLDALPRQSGVSAAQLRDTLDANARQYVRSSVLSDSLDALPRQSGVSAAQLRDSLDANARQYVRSNVLSDSLDALPRQSGVSAAQLRDTLDANARQYVRSSVLSDSLDALPRQSGVSAAQLRDTLDANARQYVRVNVLTDSLNALPRKPGISTQQVSDSLDANARKYITREDLTDTLDFNARQRINRDILTDSLDANPRISIRPSQGLTALTIDWSSAEVFADTLYSSVSYSFDNTQDGKTIVVAITNPNSYSVTWPAAVKWPYGRPPVQSGGGRTDIWTFVKVNAVVYGTAVQGY